MGAFDRVVASSIVARTLRRAAAHSAVWTAGGALLRMARMYRQRLVAGVRHEWSDEQEVRSIEQLPIHDSRLLRPLFRALRAASAGWSHQGRVRRLLAPIVDSDLDVQVRAAGIAIVAAVVVHTVLLALVGVPVQRVGWGLRLGLAAVGAFAVTRPRTVAAALRDRVAGRKG